MRCTQLLSVLGVGLWLAVVAGHQVVPPPSLSDPLRRHLTDERFQIVTSLRGLPLGVRETLQSLFGTGSLDIAEPEAAFQASAVNANPKLPSRRLVTAGCSSDHCLVHYERGGIARTWHVMLLHWAPDATRFEWGGAAAGRLATIGDIRNAILAGEIKSPASGW